MHPSKICVELTAFSEGLELQSYPDSGGVWTIGVGHTSGVGPGQTCTREQAIEWLFADLAEAATGVTRLVTVALTQGQFDALTDFVFNLGSQQLRYSHLLKYVNRQLWKTAANELLEWDHDCGRVLAGLRTRRLRDRALFLGLPLTGELALPSTGFQTEISALYDRERPYSSAP